MPTIRTDIEPLAVFPTPKGKKRSARVSIFPAEYWEKRGGAPGLYRIMLGEKFVSRPGESISFFDSRGVGEYLARWGAQALGLKVADRAQAQARPPHPMLHDRSRCRWHKPHPEGLPTAVQTWARSEPILSAAGEWVIFLSGGLGFKPCSEVVPLDHFGKPIPLPEVR